jgi:hypothetical protein
MADESDSRARSQEYHLVFSELIHAARHRGTIRYQEIAKLIGLPLSGNYMGAKIGEIAGEISEDEHFAQRPMLSAILVGTTDRPGRGFFELARTLGRLKAADRDGENQFWEAEKRAVYEAWKVQLSE